MALSNIEGKKILFFAPAFFNYEHVIMEKMREMGAIVNLYDERSVTSAWARALLKVFPRLFRHRTEKYYREIIQLNREIEYDYILIIKCDMATVSVLQELKETYPKAKLCLYLYDSIKNIPGVTQKFHMFDTIHSFDLNDCETHKELVFRPLFFADQFRREVDNGNKTYDISFLGTIHSDRYAVIQRVQELAKQQGLNCYWFMYLQSKFIFYFYRLIKKEFRNVPKETFNYDKMAAAEIAKIVNDSRIILDIQHPKQTGLTMRTIEMIGMNKKMITTNENVAKYDFYRKENIAIISRNNIHISKEFLGTVYNPLPDAIYEKYSLKSWILEVLD